MVQAATAVDSPQRRSAWSLSSWRRLPTSGLVSATTSRCRTSFWTLSRPSVALMKRSVAWTRTTSRASTPTFVSFRRSGPRLMSRGPSTTIARGRTRSSTRSLIVRDSSSQRETSTFRELSMSRLSLMTPMLVLRVRNVRLMTNWRLWESVTERTLKKLTDSMWPTRLRQMRATT